MMLHRILPLSLVVLLALLPEGSARFLGRAGGGASGGGGATNVIGIALTNENVPPSSPAGFVVGDFSATVVGGGPCTTCTWTMVTSGAPTGQGGPACTATSSNDFQLVPFGSGQAHLEVLNPSLTLRTFGSSNQFGSSNFPCVQAAPAVGTPYTFAFSVMVRGPVFTSVSPRQIQYTSGIAKSVTLSSTMCWGTATTDCHQSGTAPTPTYTLGSDAACTAPGISISGTSLNLTTSYAGSGICHVTVAASGVTCPILGSNVATPTTCVVAIDIEPHAYVGPGDGSVGMTWNLWGGLYCYNAASAGNPAITVIRESDQTFFTANCLSNGDVDIAGLANFCMDAICYAGDSPSHNAIVDQSGNSPANDMHAWADLAVNGSPLTIWRPVLTWNGINGVMPFWPTDNGTDHFFQDFVSYTGSGTTGTVETVGEEYNAATNINQYMVQFNGTTNPVTYLYFTCTISGSCGATGGVGLYVGTAAGVTAGPNIVCHAPAAGAFHSVMAAIGGTGAGQSTLAADGVLTTGTVSTVPSLTKQLGWNGGPGGGSTTGGAAELGIASTVANSTQLGQLFAIHQRIYGMSALGSC